MPNKKLILAGCFLLCSAIGFSQFQFSLATDLGVLRSFKKTQQYNTIIQTIQVHFHLTQKEGAYIWYSYSGNGAFKNNLVATAKSPSTAPQSLDFKAYSHIKYNSLSLGWKHYLRGSFNAEESWSLYFAAGFGLVVGKVNNMYTVPKDTLSYEFPERPADGKGKFTRLSFDAAIGYEVPIGMEIYLYGECRAWIPASDYPSKYLTVNQNAPMVGTVNLGLRIFFD